MEKQGESRRVNRLVLVVYPFQGHLNPMLQLATALHSKGFSITIVHPQFNFPNPSNSPEFTFVPISDNLSHSKVSPADVVATNKTLNKNCETPFQECMKKMLEEEDPNNRIRCIIYDGLMYFAQTVADNLKLPGISFRTSAAATILAFSVLLNPNEQGSVPQDLTPEIRSLKIKETVLSKTGYPKDAMLELRANMTSAMKASSANIVNTMDFLEQEALTNIQQYFPAPILTIGPFHKLAPTESNSLLKEDKSCISWLDKQTPKSVLYVSFGSVASMSEKDLVEIAWGLADSEQPFLWVIRPGLVHGPDLTELLPENFHDRVRDRGCIVQWAPQKEVLAHGAVAGFWSHCGWNSTLESVCEGIPMLCRPFFGDQPLNVRYICHIWKTGFELEKELERAKIEKAIRRLMVDKQGEEVRQKAMEFKEKAELCFREGGSSYCALNKLVQHILSC